MFEEMLLACKNVSILSFRINGKCHWRVLKNFPNIRVRTVAASLIELTGVRELNLRLEGQPKEALQEVE
jgi:hypothetical protein